MKNPSRQKAPQTAEYSIEEFQTAYNLTLVDAVDLFHRFGPYKADLDALLKTMKARRLHK